MAVNAKPRPSLFARTRVVDPPSSLPRRPAKKSQDYPPSLGPDYAPKVWRTFGGTRRMCSWCGASMEADGSAVRVCSEAGFCRNCPIEKAQKARERAVAKPSVEVPTERWGPRWRKAASSRPIGQLGHDYLVHAARRIEARRAPQAQIVGRALRALAARVLDEGWSEASAVDTLSASAQTAESEEVGSALILCAIGIRHGAHRKAPAIVVAEPAPLEQTTPHSAKLKEPAIPAVRPAREPTGNETHENNCTYQHERVRCGKALCICTRGKLHGPYWYGYARHEGRVRSWYVGKNLDGSRKAPPWKRQAPGKTRRPRRAPRSTGRAGRVDAR